MSVDITPDIKGIDVGTLGLASQVTAWAKKAVQGERLTVVDTNQAFLAMTTAGDFDSTVVGLATIIFKSDNASDPTGAEGVMCINTVNNTIKMYADGAWRQLANW